MFINDFNIYYFSYFDVDRRGIEILHNGKNNILRCLLKIHLFSHVFFEIIFVTFTVDVLKISSKLTRELSPVNDN